MSYVLTSLIALWTIVLLLFSARWLDDLRVVHNNIAPEASDMNYMKPGLYYRMRFLYSGINPAKLTPTGRERLKLAIWNERAMYAWMVVGFFLFAYLF